MVSDPESDIDVEDTEPTDDETPSDVRYDDQLIPRGFHCPGHARQVAAVSADHSRVPAPVRLEPSRRVASSSLSSWDSPSADIPLPRAHESEAPGCRRAPALADPLLQGRFDEKRLFRLTGVDKRWNGLTYDALPEDDRIALDDTTMRSIVIQQTAPDDDSSIYQIFERLNTSGTQLNAMEIRKALYHEHAYPFLEGLSKLDSWRRILGIATEDKRLKDVELVLRVLALADGVGDYTKPMKRFITTYMRRLDRTPLTELDMLGLRKPHGVQPILMLSETDRSISADVSMSLHLTRSWPRRSMELFQTQRPSVRTTQHSKQTQSSLIRPSAIPVMLPS